jgi:hypothetical protein
VHRPHGPQSGSRVVSLTPAKSIDRPAGHSPQNDRTTRRWPPAYGPVMTRMSVSAADPRRLAARIVGAPTVPHRYHHNGVAIPPLVIRLRIVPRWRASRKSGVSRRIGQDAPYSGVADSLRGITSAVPNRDRRGRRHLGAAASVLLSESAKMRRSMIRQGQRRTNRGGTTHDLWSVRRNGNDAVLRARE